jgi:hypothetical protein
LEDGSDDVEDEQESHRQRDVTEGTGTEEDMPGLWMDDPQVSVRV